ncbi:GGDEF domain-containing protein (plasmid) [Microvirga sp. RSM25]|uniref:GGDEF domain-containing protein n=1 Tax=Microvirga sp. RSM25 TaxID=3273802 RepID=UPI0038500B4A
MKLDFPTLGTVFVVNTAVLTALLLFAWAVNHQVRALAWWGLAFFLVLAGMGLMVVAQGAPTLVIVLAANILLMLAYGALYEGCRVFNGRLLKLPCLFIGAIVWCAAFPLLFDHSSARLILTSAIGVGYSALAAWELWRHAPQRLASQFAAIILLISLAGFNVVRGALGFSLAHALWIDAPAPQGSGLMALAVATFMPAIAFVFLSMAKEQLASEYRRAALVDPLTGIPNRRAFFEKASAVLSGQRTAPVSCLLFDLDNFKNLNDSHGHEVGDHVLEIFGRVLSDHLPDSVFGRLGGEEFGAMAPLGQAEAEELAETIRHAFASVAMVVRGLRLNVTVSVGCATGVASTVQDLLREADIALYQAKARGRNRVASRRN